MHWIRTHALLVIFVLIALLSYLWYFSIKYKPQIRTAVPTYSIMSEEDIPARPFFSFDTNPADTTYGQDFGQASRVVADNQQYSYAPSFNSSAPAQKTDAPSNTSSASAQAPTPEESSMQAKTSATGLNSWFNNPYSFIPRGLISASISKPKVRMSEEQALYDYGNAVGENIKAFENTHKNTNEILKGFFPEKGGFASQNQTAVNAVLSLANDYVQLGNTLAKTSAVPDSVQTLHIALAKSYADVGAGLAMVAKTGADGDITKAILAYDSIADMFIKNFVALAEFFSALGIKFSETDPGNVFQFRN